MNSSLLTKSTALSILFIGFVLSAAAGPIGQDCGFSVTGENEAQSLINNEESDRLCRDIDGNGEFGELDVQIFFNNLENQEVQNHVSSLDFQEDREGEINILDVQELYQDSVRGSEVRKKFTKDMKNNMTKTIRMFLVLKFKNSNI